MNLEVGKTYNVTHSRKGKFQMKINSTDGEWISGIITNGTADAILDYNRKEEGENITVRISLIKNIESVA